MCGPPLPSAWSAASWRCCWPLASEKSPCSGRPRASGESSRWPRPLSLVTSFISILTQWVAFSTYYTFTANVAMALGRGSRADPFADRPAGAQYPVKRPGGPAFYPENRRQHPGGGQALSLAPCTACWCPWRPTCRVLYALQTLENLTSTLTFAVLLGQCVRDTAPAKRSVAMGFYQAGVWHWHDPGACCDGADDQRRRA